MLTQLVLVLLLILNEVLIQRGLTRRGRLRRGGFKVLRTFRRGSCVVQQFAWFASEGMSERERERERNRYREKERQSSKIEN